MGWARLSPKGLGWSQPNSSLCFFGRAGPESKNGEGNYFPPPILLHAERYLIFVLHARETYTENEVKVEGKKSYLARRTWCLAGLAASLAVLRWRPVAVSWLTDDSSKQWCCCFKRRRERLLLFPSPLVFRLSFSSFVVKWFPSLYSLLSCLFLSQTLPCFELPRILSFLSLFCFLSFLFSPSSLFSPHPLCWCWE